MTFPALSAGAWLFAAAASLCVGVSKAGFSGVGMMTVLFMAEAVEARGSTGIVLPLLIVGDLLAVRKYRHHADWSFILRLLPPALLGIVVASLIMPSISEFWFRKTLGAIILILAILHWIRMFHPKLISEIPDSKGLAWIVGGAGGVTTMIGNAAGPITALYLLMMRLPKYEFVGTSACFFMAINLFKVPFSAAQGLIDANSLLLNLILVPGVILGFLIGNAWLKNISQIGFEKVLLFLTCLAAIKLVLF